MSKETYYFSHDYNARTDERIKLLIRKYGMIGYGVFWSIVEDLYNNANALRLDYEGIAYDLRTDIEIIKSIINDFDLFVINGELFGSSSIERRLDERRKKSKSASKSAIIRWKKFRMNANASKTDANALRPECEGNAIKERKGKEKNKYGPYKNVFLKEIEYKKLKDEYKLETDLIIDNYSGIKEMKGYNYKSDYLAIKKWGVHAYYKEHPKEKKRGVVV